ncbi:LAMI_0A02740g1_1 [Lachancea mirantina]|uniref:LAMI_0A02740g1_1 n=1 Tax=Lachancea mirantina TaxID=1230905 RepID=A0A1G4IMM3_9SACH|nr:LAMI_0A02740g1_1 [Lachancea mirantina]
MDGRAPKRRRTLAPMTQFEGDSQSAAKDIDELPLHAPGYIKTVQLQNFMCHENFEINLGPQLNFIVGRNGSGKSAILTAITVGLGAKAAETNRGASLKDLIREGCNMAKIQIILDNQGPSGFEQDSYGSQIIVERTLKKTGDTAFSLKSETGRKISSKKADLQTILDYFGVPISNPMCFLSQDAARSFLTASTAADKYMHFMKGTQLKETEDNLNQAYEVTLEARDQLHFHERGLKALRAEYESAQRIFRELNEHQDLNKRKRVLQGKLLWLTVQENEGLSKKLESKLKEYEDRRAIIDSKIAARKAKTEQFTRDQQEIEEQIETVAERWQERKTDLDIARGNLMQLETECNTKGAQRKETEEELRKTIKTVEELERKVQSLEEELKRQRDGEGEKMEQELSGIQIENKQLNSDLINHQNDLENLKDKLKTLLHKKNEELRELHFEVDKKQQELRTMNNVTPEEQLLMNFHPKIKDVLKAVRDARRKFVEAPIGPLGLSLTIKKEFEEWTRPIQAYLGGELKCFVVSNSRDRQELSSILRQYNVNHLFTVVVYKFSKFEFMQGKARTSYSTVLDALEFDIPSLKYLLIDLKQIEGVILVKDKREARKVFDDDKFNVQRVLSPLNARQGIQAFKRRGAGFSSNIVSYQERLSLKQASSSNDDIGYLKAVIEEEKHRIWQRESDFNVNLQQLERDIQEKKKTIDQMQKRIAKLNERDVDLRVRLERSKNVGDESLERAKIQANSYKSVIGGYKNTLNEIDDSLNTVSESKQSLKARYEECVLELREVEHHQQELKNSISHISANLEKYKEDQERYVKKQADIVARQAKTTEEMKRFEDGIKKQEEQANIYCPRDVAFQPDVPPRREDVKTEIEEISFRIQSAERNLGMSQNEVLSLLENTKTKYTDAHEKYSKIDQVIALLEGLLRKRQQSFFYARRDTCFTADADFKQSLRFRNFSGGLHFDLERKTLDMLVKTANDERPRNVNTLSGGEKSFCQLSLLMATWRPIRSRLIALDEFDVFMDQVNRQIGTRFIIREFSKRSRAQTIIITPQDISKIADVNQPGLQIYKMDDPQRHNISEPM